MAARRRSRGPAPARHCLRHHPRGRVDAAVCEGAVTGASGQRRRDSEVLSYAALRLRVMTGPHRNDVVMLPGLAIASPGLHQRAPLLQRVAAPVGLLGSDTDHKGVAGKGVTVYACRIRSGSPCLSEFRLAIPCGSLIAAERHFDRRPHRYSRPIGPSWCDAHSGIPRGYRQHVLHSSLRARVGVLLHRAGTPFR